MTTWMKELVDEKRRFKKMYAEEKLKAETMSAAMQKKWSSHLTDVR